MNNGLTIGFWKLKMYCFSGGVDIWAEYLANTIELKILLRIQKHGVIFASEETEKEKHLYIPGINKGQLFTGKEIIKIINT